MNPSRSLELLAIVALTASVTCAAAAPPSSAAAPASSTAVPAPSAAAPASSTGAPPTSTASGIAPLPAIELAKALAWPLVALLLALAFRRTITEFVAALGSRASKLSLFKVELELAPDAKPATATPWLDDIRTGTTAAPVGDSLADMVQEVQSREPADYAEIGLGDGKEWLTSRLYIAAVMMERMRGIKVFVFLERAPATRRRLVAVTSVQQLRWKLARRYPWLEVAWTHALTRLFPPPFDLSTILLPQDFFLSDTGALDPWRASDLVSAFISSLQRKPPPAPDPNDTEWVTLDSTRQERSAWVTSDLLVSLLPQKAFDAWANELRDAPRAERTRAVLRSASPFVALVDGNHEFVRLANRQALLEEIAASLGEEPALRPSGT
jgi:hypothetical protein